MLGITEHSTVPNHLNDTQNVPSNDKKSKGNPKKQNCSSILITYLNLVLFYFQTLFYIVQKSMTPLNSPLCCGVCCKIVLSLFISLPFNAVKRIIPCRVQACVQFSFFPHHHSRNKLLDSIKHSMISS